MKASAIHLCNTLLSHKDREVRDLAIIAKDYIENPRDEYHTISELYDHRMMLNVALFNIIYQANRFQRVIPINVVKSKMHFDGSMFEGGYFIVMAVTEIGQISYHYKLEHWDLFKIPVVERTPEWDGHTPEDALKRLSLLI